MLARVWGQAMVMAPPPMCDSAVFPCSCGCLAFLHRHFPPRSPLSHPIHLSLHSQQQPSPWPWDCSTIPKLPTSHYAFQETCVPVWGVFGCGKDCLILIPFRLRWISCFTFSFEWFFSDSDNCSDVEIGLLLQLLHPSKAGPVLLTLLFSP